MKVSIKILIAATIGSVIILTSLLLIYMIKTGKTSYISDNTSTRGTLNTSQTGSVTSSKTSSIIYRAMDMSFEFEYPSEWRISYSDQSDPRTGFAPAEIMDLWSRDNMNFSGILIVRKLLNEGGLKSTAENYHGVGETNLLTEVGGYEAYKITVNSEEFTDISYTIRNGDTIVDFLFRKKDGSYTSGDYSRYEDDFYSIVNSVRVP